MKKEEEHDPMKWTKEAENSLDAAVASTPAGHPDAAKLKGRSDTPRTDAAFAAYPVMDTQSGRNAVLIEFPKQLERELAQTKDRLPHLFQERREAEEECKKLEGDVAEMNRRLIDRTSAGLAKTSELQRELNSANAQIVALSGALLLAEQSKRHATDKYVKMCPLCNCVKAWDENHQPDCAIGNALSSPAPAVVPLEELQPVFEAFKTYSVLDSVVLYGALKQLYDTYSPKHQAKGGADE